MERQLPDANGDRLAIQRVALHKLIGRNRLYVRQLFGECFRLDVARPGLNHLCQLRTRFVVQLDPVFDVEISSFSHGLDAPHDLSGQAFSPQVRGDLGVHTHGYPLLCCYSQTWGWECPHQNFLWRQLNGLAVQLNSNSCSLIHLCGDYQWICCGKRRVSPVKRRSC